MLSNKISVRSKYGIVKTLWGAKVQYSAVELILNLQSSTGSVNGSAQSSDIKAHLFSCNTTLTSLTVMLHSLPGKNLQTLQCSLSCTEKPRPAASMAKLAT